MAKYVCSTHTNITDKVDSDGESLFRWNEVNWQGKGCIRCKYDHEKRMKKREIAKKRRAARRAGEVYRSDEEEE